MGKLFSFMSWGDWDLKMSSDCVPLGGQENKVCFILQTLPLSLLFLLDSWLAETVLECPYWTFMPHPHRQRCPHYSQPSLRRDHPLLSPFLLYRVGTILQWLQSGYSKFMCVYRSERECVICLFQIISDIWKLPHFLIVSSVDIIWFFILESGPTF